MDETLLARLGRRPAPDDRDHQHLLRTAVSVDPLETLPHYPRRFWYDNGAWLDQGSTPQCVAYSWTHFVEDSPITHPESPSPGGTVFAPADLYHEAQLLDEWAGTEYDGTSVRAGAKALQARGFLTEYLWAFDVDTLIRWVLEKGPAVLGVNWYWSMFEPRSGTDALGGRRAFLNVDSASGLAGGHAFVVNGVNIERRIFRMKNSWGRDWGVDGRLSISFEDMDYLLRDEGEACTALEVRKA
jgi:hypothetical protein